MPTTHELGPNGGFDDWEYHEDVATRFGVFGHARGRELVPRSVARVRVNAQLIRINRSPVSSSFGYYLGGQRGMTASLAVSFTF